MEQTLKHLVFDINGGDILDISIFVFFSIGIVQYCNKKENIYLLLLHVQYYCVHSLEHIVIMKLMTQACEN